MPKGHPRQAEVPQEAREFMCALAARRPELSASRVLTSLQSFALVAGIVLLLVGFATRWTVALIALNALFLAFYLVVVVFKSYLIHLSITSRREMHFTAEDLAWLRWEDLPVYTILVPLYDESEVLPRLMEGLKGIEYPKDKLDVILLLEKDDMNTIRASRAFELPEFVRIVIVPDEGPRTKPKACNVGLAMARGEFLVVYDAEDRPEPDQLLKAVAAFRKVPQEVICLQAKLNFYNQRQNLLTRWFTTDYSVWFDLMLPGLDYLEAPIPLGGTSNHFRIGKLRELFGWDPYNVTEDCDLGVRLAMHGYRTRIIDSTTWEEACSALSFWIRQRSRWTKGYAQTYLVYLRQPLEHFRRLGLGRALAFHLMVGGTLVCLLANPVYWCLTTVWFVLRWEAFSALFPFPLILWGLICLFVGNFLFIYSTMLATYQRGYYDLVKHCILVPVYWMMASIGAWKGFLQLITRPSYWEKTKHGLDLTTGGGAQKA